MARGARAGEAIARDGEGDAREHPHDQVDIAQHLGGGPRHGVVGEEGAREHGDSRQRHRDGEGGRGHEPRQESEGEKLCGQEPGGPEPRRLAPQQDGEGQRGEDPQGAAQPLATHPVHLPRPQPERELTRQHDVGHGEEMGEEGGVPHRRPVGGAPLVEGDHVEGGEEEGGRAAPRRHGRGQTRGNGDEDGALDGPGQGDPRALERQRYGQGEKDAGQAHEHRHRGFVVRHAPPVQSGQHGVEDGQGEGGGRFQDGTPGFERHVHRPEVAGGGARHDEEIHFPSAHALAPLAGERA